MKRIVLVMAALALATVSPRAEQAGGKPEATSLAGKPLMAPATIPNKAKLDADLAQAEKTLAANPKDPEALIWVGRRQGYLWQYQDAIATFTNGIAMYPDDPKFYRHRGHRYITMRDFAKAQADFEKAAALIKGKPDEIEPDGAPNPAGKPRSTLQFNIWYHLGLAHYLQGNYAKAYDAYVECMKVSDNDDSVTATSDWMWMTLMRLNRKADAAKVLERIHAEDGHPRERLVSPPAAHVQGPGEARGAARHGEGRRHDHRHAGLRRRQLLLRDGRHGQGARGVPEGHVGRRLERVRLHRGRSRPAADEVGVPHEGSSRRFHTGFHTEVPHDGSARW